MTPTENTIKQRLKVRFFDQILFSSRMDGMTYVNLANNLYDILTDAWYNNRKQTIEEEEKRLIDSASKLIRRKIRSKISRLNEYPASDNIFDKIDEIIPPLLLRFLQNIICKDKKQNARNNIWYSRKKIHCSRYHVCCSTKEFFISTSTRCRCYVL